MIATHDLNDLRNKIDLRDLVRAHRPLSTSKHLSPNRRQIALPCPGCGGTDRFCVSRDVWLCRQCAPPEPGRRRDLFELIVFLGLASDFPSAVAYANQWAGGGVSVTPVQVTPSPHQAKPQRRGVSAEWIAAHVAQAANRLPGSAGDAYLAQRGLTAATMRAFRLGYQPDVLLPGADRKEAAITIPWLSPDGRQVTRLGYRYLTTHEYTDQDGREQVCKYRIMGRLTYQPDALFGAHLLTGANTLIITEGEFNACSVWQESTADVVSFGSQTIHQRQLERLVAMAQPYPHVVAWLDEARNAAVLAQALSGHSNVTPIKSPRGMDANELLQRGLLAQFLTKLTGQHDLTHYIGQTIGGAAWAALQLECQRRGWTVEGTQTSQGWHVDRLNIKSLEN